MQQPGVLLRTFEHNEVGWLRSADHPELPALVTHQYDANGNLTNKALPSGKTVQFQRYDELNRLKRKVLDSGDGELRLRHVLDRGAVLDDDGPVKTSFTYALSRVRTAKSATLSDRAILQQLGLASPDKRRGPTN